MKKLLALALCLLMAFGTVLPVFADYDKTLGAALTAITPTLTAPEGDYQFILAKDFERAHNHNIQDRIGIVAGTDAIYYAWTGQYKHNIFTPVSGTYEIIPIIYNSGSAFEYALYTNANSVEYKISNDTSTATGSLLYYPGFKAEFTANNSRNTFYTEFIGGGKTPHFYGYLIKAPSGATPVTYELATLADLPENVNSDTVYYNAYESLTAIGQRARIAHYTEEANGFDAVTGTAHGDDIQCGFTVAAAGTYDIVLELVENTVWGDMRFRVDNTAKDYVITTAKADTPTSKYYVIRNVSLTEGEHTLDAYLFSNSGAKLAGFYVAESDTSLAGSKTYNFGDYADNQPTLYNVTANGGSVNWGKNGFMTPADGSIIFFGKNDASKFPVVDGESIKSWTYDASAAFQVPFNAPVDGTYTFKVTLTKGDCKAASTYKGVEDDYIHTPIKIDNLTYELRYPLGAVSSQTAFDLCEIHLTAGQHTLYLRPPAYTTTNHNYYSFTFDYVADAIGGGEDAADDTLYSEINPLPAMGGAVAGAALAQPHLNVINPIAPPATDETIDTTVTAPSAPAATDAPAIAPAPQQPHLPTVKPAEPNKPGNHRGQTPALPA